MYEYYTVAYRIVGFKSMVTNCLCHFKYTQFERNYIMYREITLSEYIIN